MKNNVCKECQFEARNGHSASCSQRGGSRTGNILTDKRHIKCPSCAEHGRYGTLEKLTEEERQRLQIREGKDNYPEEIWGCDECRFWCDVEELDNL